MSLRNKQQKKELKKQQKQQKEELKNRKKTIEYKAEQLVNSKDLEKKFQKAFSKGKNYIYIGNCYFLDKINNLAIYSFNKKIEDKHLFVNCKIKKDWSGLNNNHYYLYYDPPTHILIEEVMKEKLDHQLHPLIPIILDYRCDRY